ncbi:MAG: GGDEF domain-containing protein [Butyrivibrio sp.]|nr:GGDEF domain-containing protein [Butyrivibrio sp.]
MANKRIQTPLKRSVKIVCFLFVLILCLCLGVSIYLSYKNFFFKQSQEHIRNIITYVIGHIDNDDLKNCSDTKVESDKYKELMTFMDDVKEDLDPQYLYIIRPLREDGGNHVMIILTAENNYDRYENTEGNLYLGDITEDEYTKEEVDNYHKIMEAKDIVFMESATYWGHSYCGFYTLRDSHGAPYGILGVDIDLTQMYKDILFKTFDMLLIVIIIGGLFIFVFLIWTSKNITDPIEMLEKSALGYIEQSKYVSSPDKLKFEKPNITIKNEVESLSNTIDTMTENIKDYMLQVIEAEKETAHMKEVANTDSLTGVKNKLAFKERVEFLNGKIQENLIKDFGIVMMDLNYLKSINDNYGHEYGDILIQTFCDIICDIFVHSPVYRIGGDEFVIILQGKDLGKRDKLLLEFEDALKGRVEKGDYKPWECPSVALGFAHYDKNLDTCVEDVFRRADAAMYRRKKEMKAERTV